MDIQTLQTGKGKVEYSSTGAGKPILFLHGGHSNCRETLFHKGFSTQHYRLITPSRPGYGNTPLDDHRTPRKSADLIVSMLDSIKLDTVILYAISAGGLTAIEFAANYPKRVEKLILASAVSKKWLDEEGKMYKTARRIFNPRVEGFVWGMVRLLSKYMPGVIAKGFYPQFSTNKPHPPAKEDVRELVSTFRHFRSKTGFMCDIDHTIADDTITKISCPTLIIHSKNDNSVLFDHAEHAHEKIRHSRLVALDNEWGHLFWIGNDSELPIRETLDFIKTGTSKL